MWRTTVISYTLVALSTICGAPLLYLIHWYRCPPYVAHHCYILYIGSAVHHMVAHHCYILYIGATSTICGAPLLYLIHWCAVHHMWHTTVISYTLVRRPPYVAHHCYILYIGATSTICGAPLLYLIHWCDVHHMWRTTVISYTLVRRPPYVAHHCYILYTGAQCTICGTPLLYVSHSILRVVCEAHLVKDSGTIIGYRIHYRSFFKIIITCQKAFIYLPY